MGNETKRKKHKSASNQVVRKKESGRSIGRGFFRSWNFGWVNFCFDDYFDLLLRTLKLTETTFFNMAKNWALCTENLPYNRPTRVIITYDQRFFETNAFQDGKKDDLLVPTKIYGDPTTWLVVISPANLQKKIANTSAESDVVDYRSILSCILYSAFFNKTIKSKRRKSFSENVAEREFAEALQISSKNQTSHIS